MRPALALKQSGPVLHHLSAGRLPAIGPVLIAVLVLSGLACPEAIRAGTTWIEPFESYASETFPSPLWINSGNDDVKIDSQVRFAGQSSLRLFGELGSCWGALAHRVLDTVPPYEIEFLVRNGSETLFGCHPDHGGVQLNTGPSWTTPVRALIKFNRKGEIRSYEGGNQGDGIFLGAYVHGEWYRVKILYVVVATDTVQLSFWINGQFRGSQKLPAKSAEANFAYLAITSNEGTAWFDDVKVTHLDALNPELLGVTPNRGGDSGQVTVTITTSGINLTQTPTVKLAKAGESEIVAQEVAVEGDSVTARFDLAGRSLGLQDLVVIDAAGRELRLADAFTIEEGVAPQLWVDIVGRSAIRAGRAQTAWIVYGNRGNVDVSDVVTWVSVPHGLSTQIEAPHLQDLGTTQDEPPIPVQGRDFYWLLTERLGPGETKSFSFTIASFVAEEIKIQSGIFSGTLFQEDLQQKSLVDALSHSVAETSELQVGDLVFKGDDPDSHLPTGHVGMYVGDTSSDDPLLYATCKTRCVVDFVPTSPFVGEVRLKPFEEWDAHNVQRGSGRPPGLTQGLHAAEKAKDYYRTHHNKPLSFLIPPIPIAGSNDCVSMINKFYRDVGYPVPWTDWSSPGAIFEEVTGRYWPDHAYTAYLLSRRAAEIFFPRETQVFKTVIELLVNVVASIDPNEKLGSRGGGVEQAISNAEPLRYTIAFENNDTATAPAQEVVVSDLLDGTKVDLSTLSLGPITFGKWRVVPPAGSRAFVTTLDLRPEKNLVVRIEANLDVGSGLLTWRFTSIDPATGGLPEDPFAGFLPPNINPPEGEGSVLFTVMPKADLPTGTEIRNRASITFDTNAPIETQEWLNTLDNTKPSSQVLALASVQGSLDFEVQWSGADVGSGIKSYDLWVSEDGGAFSSWLTGTTETAAIFHGVSGRTYSFYSIARDWTDNLEETPLAPDSATQVAILPPVIRSISPESGPMEGGTAVTISGSGFAAGATVLIGGVS
ncbi:MAG: DUF7619 domain-containing protein, partial [Nitrospira sp.]